MEKLMLISLGLLILSITSRKMIKICNPFTILAFSTSSIGHKGASNYHTPIRQLESKNENHEDEQIDPAASEPDEEDLLLEEKRLILRQKENLDNRLKEIAEEILKAKRLFRRVIKTINISPCPEESTYDLTRKDRLLYGATSWDHGQNRRQMPDHNPATEQETAYMIEIRRHSEESDYKNYEAKKLIEVIGGETEVWDNQTLTLQQIERICLELGDELEVNKNYKFFFRGQNSNNEPRLIIMEAEIRPGRIAFVLEDPSDWFKANDILFLKTKPDPKRFKDKDLT